MVAVDAALITLRESLEAFLIVSIFAGLVVKLGRRETRKYLLWGAAAAIAVSVLVGMAMDATARRLFEDSGSAELFEGLASLLAVGILTYMVVWMYRHTLTMIEGLRKKTVTALSAGQPVVLFSVAFVAVVREGLETVLFFATLTPSTSAADLVLAALLGLAVSGVVAFLVFTGIVRLNIKKFFAATGVLLIFFAGGLLVTSLHELAEVGWVPEVEKAWNTEFLLDQHSTPGSLAKAVFGYRESPTVLEATAYFLYVLGMGAWYLRGIQLWGRAGRPVPAQA